TAQHLACAGAHVERQRDGVVDHDVRRQVAFALAGLVGLGQHPPHLLDRKRPGDHAEADMITEADAGGEAGENTGHRRRSRKSQPTAYASISLSEQYWS